MEEEYKNFINILTQIKIKIALGEKNEDIVKYIEDNQAKIQFKICDLDSASSYMDNLIDNLR